MLLQFNGKFFTQFKYVFLPHLWFFNFAEFFFDIIGSKSIPSSNLPMLLSLRSSKNYWRKCMSHNAACEVKPRLSRRQGLRLLSASANPASNERPLARARKSLWFFQIVALRSFEIQDDRRLRSNSSDKSLLNDLVLRKTSKDHNVRANRGCHYTLFSVQIVECE